MRGSVLAVLLLLGVGLAKVTLFGHSMRGPVTLEAALAGVVAEGNAH